MSLLLRPWSRFLDFGGRSRRLELLLFHLQLWAVIVAIFYFGVPAPSAGQDAIRAGFAFALPAIVGVLLVSAIPLLSVTTRRLHDCDMAGTWLLTLLVPALFTLLTLFLLIQGGSEGENSFGPDPRGRTSDD